MSGKTGWSKVSCKQALQLAADELGESPTIEQYRNLEIGFVPSVAAIQRTFGSWNDAKETAGLQTFGRGFHRNYRHLAETRHEAAKLSGFTPEAEGSE